MKKIKLIYPNGQVIVKDLFTFSLLINFIEITFKDKYYIIIDILNIVIISKPIFYHYTKSYYENNFESLYSNNPNDDCIELKLFIDEDYINLILKNVSDFYKNLNYININDYTIGLYDYLNRNKENFSNMYKHINGFYPKNDIKKLLYLFDIIYEEIFNYIMNFLIKKYSSYELIVDILIKYMLDNDIYSKIDDYYIDSIIYSFINLIYRDVSKWSLYTKETRKQMLRIKNKVCHLLKYFSTNNKSENNNDDYVYTLEDLKC